MALEVKQLRLAHGKRILAEQLTFTLNPPFFLAIVGRNGAGKSTLLHALTRNIPYQGSILADGQDILFFNPREMAAKFSLIMQKNSAVFDLSVKDLLLMGRYRFRGFMESYLPEDELYCQEALDTIGAKELWSRSFHELSGGEQQLVWIAQAIVQQAKYILMDEPAQFLDVYFKKRIYDLIFELPKRYQCGVICVTHDLQELERAEGYLLDFSLPSLQLDELTVQGLAEAKARMERGE